MDLDPASWGGLKLGLKIWPVKTSTAELPPLESGAVELSLLVPEDAELPPPEPGAANLPPPPEPRDAASAAAEARRCKAGARSCGGAAGVGEMWWLNLSARCPLSGRPGSPADRLRVASERGPHAEPPLRTPFVGPIAVFTVYIVSGVVC